MRRSALVALVMLGACTDAEDPAEREPWTAATALPGRRLEAAVAAYGTRLVVAGGFSTSAAEGLAITREVAALDTFTGAWTPLPELPVAWTHGALAAVGTTLYLLGGLEGPTYAPRGEAFALELGAATWRELPAMPAGLERGAAGVVVAPPRVYLVGGEAGGAALASVLAFDTATSMWISAPDLPAPRSHPAAIREEDGTIVVAGGLGTADGDPRGETYALPLGAASWEARAPMTTPRGGCAYGRVAGWLVCAGGEAGAALRTAEAYDPVADVWYPLPDAPEPRAGAPGAAIGQRLYVAGGSASLAFQPTDSLYVLSLLDALAR